MCQILVGKFIYLSHTRPDIVYAVSVVSQFTYNPSKDHMEAVIRIMRNMKSLLGKSLTLINYNHVQVQCYIDADWAWDITNNRSTWGYFMFIRGNLVTWKSKKQKIVALWSAEAEFWGMVNGIFDVLCLWRLLIEIGFDLNSAMNFFLWQQVCSWNCS